MKLDYCYLGDCRDVLPTLPDCSVDSIVTDPPYEIGFMGRKWDSSGIAYDVAMWRECLRVLKPGGHLVAFGHSRTYHRLACAIEDAGFGIRDQLIWLYAQGFPKGQNLKPAHEPMVLARKSGSGVLQIDAGRIPAGAEYAESCASVVGHVSQRHKHVFNGLDKPRTDAFHAAGRWPANLIHDGSEEVIALFPADNPGCRRHRVAASDESVARNKAKGWGFGRQDGMVGYDDDDLSASRYFYCAKATQNDRNEGLPDGMVNNWPTVKPTTLIRHLHRLVTPIGGITLDPFWGSGTQGKSATLEGFRWVSIEKDPAGRDIGMARVAHVAGRTGMFADAVVDA